MSSFPKPARSRFPNSTSLPNSATDAHDACSSSPESEFKTRSTPRPPVTFLRSVANEASRELNMWSRGIPALSMRYCTFSSDPTVANIFAPMSVLHVDAPWESYLGA